MDAIQRCFPEFDRAQFDVAKNRLVAQVHYIGENTVALSAVGLMGLSFKSIGIVRLATMTASILAILAIELRTFFPVEYQQIKGIVDEYKDRERTVENATAIRDLLRGLQGHRRSVSEGRSKSSTGSSKDGLIENWERVMRCVDREVRPAYRRFALLYREGVIDLS